MKSLCKILWFITIALALMGCSSVLTMGDIESSIYSNGYISVESPEIWTQERLLSFRNEEAEWLKNQLSERKMNEVGQGFQAQRETRLQVLKRVLSGYQEDQEWQPIRKAEIKSRVADIKRAQEQADLMQQLQSQQVKQEIANGQKTGETTTPTTATIPNTTAMTISPKALSNSSGRLDSSYLPDIDPTEAWVSRSENTSVDKFRDMLAYRDAVNSARQENLLDDISDKFGNTVYLLKFDISVLPGADTEKDAFAEVTFGVEPEPVDWKRFHSMLVQAINKKIPEEIISLTKRFKETLLHPNSDVLTEEERFDLYQEIESNKQSLLQSSAGNLQNTNFPMEMPTPERLQNLLLPMQNAQNISGNLLELEEKILRSAIKNYVSNKYQRVLSRYMKFRVQEVNALRQEVFYRIYAYDYTKNPEAYTEEEIRVIQGEIEKLLQEMRKNCKIYTYAVTPKEYVQNISDVATKENLLDMLFEISTILSDGSKIDEFAKYIRRAQEFFNTILRKPLIVGFCKGTQTFGWLFGPRFNIQQSATDVKVEFLHKPEYHTVRAFVVLPSFYEYLTLYVQKNWICYSKGPEWPPIISWFGTKNGVQRLYNLDAQIGIHQEYQRMKTVPRSEWENWRHREIEGILPLSKIHVALPAKSSAALDYVMENHGFSLREPLILNVTPNPILANQESSTLIVEGHNLWRNTSVFLGSYPASYVECLPDLKGIIATFGPIPFQSPDGNNSQYSLPLVVSTAYGTRKYNINIKNPYEIMIPESLQFAPLRYYIINHQDKIDIEMLSGKIPEEYSRIVLSLSPINKPDAAKLNLVCSLSGIHRRTLTTNDVCSIKDPDKFWGINKSEFPLELRGVILLEGINTVSIPLEESIILYERDEQKATIQPDIITLDQLKELKINLPKKAEKAYPELMRNLNNNRMKLQVLGETFSLVGNSKTLQLSGDASGLASFFAMLQRIKFPTELTMTLIGSTNSFTIMVQPNLRVVNP